MNLSRDSIFLQHGQPAIRTTSEQCIYRIETEREKHLTKTKLNKNEKI